MHRHIAMDLAARVPIYCITRPGVTHSLAHEAALRTPFARG